MKVNWDQEKFRRKMWSLTLWLKGSRELGSSVSIQGESGTEKIETQECMYNTQREHEMPGLWKQRASITRRPRKV